MSALGAALPERLRRRWRRLCSLSLGRRLVGSGAGAGALGAAGRRHALSGGLWLLGWPAGGDALRPRLSAGWLGCGGGGCCSSSPTDGAASRRDCPAGTYAVSHTAALYTWPSDCTVALGSCVALSCGLHQRLTAPSLPKLRFVETRAFQYASSSQAPSAPFLARMSSRITTSRGSAWQGMVGG